MNPFNKYVGLDAHKDTIAVGVAESQGGAQLAFCYEAGPCGYGIHRQWSGLGWETAKGWPPC